MASTKVQRIMTQPINLIFRFLQSKARIQIWLFEQKDLRIEGRIIVSFLALFLIQTAKLSTSNSLLAPGNSLLAPVYANSCVVLGDKLS
ncbi:Small nuclear ribonucleoprotein family protein [Zea mays]|uniref:Small nuclear ribonucleoprotein family protein n=1 Tax=Zea mays TaxID=4577 RepID=A0A1D6MFZ6_MAIZE|nr:Small nuclear ribonucleoprotein family protein [Zea mays]